jgi:hypothetical protein
MNEFLLSHFEARSSFDAATKRVASELQAKN